MFMQILEKFQKDIVRKLCRMPLNMDNKKLSEITSFLGHTTQKYTNNIELASLCVRAGYKPLNVLSQELKHIAGNMLI